ncbi:MAG: hypothetical protein KGH72_06180, partial [Candidatus Micrarchaeota archaeon]|nr:hypothetical protein [Candidatus Micrarchaeota archaeon]
YKIFIHNMVKSSRVFAIWKGHYTLHEDPMIGGFAFSPFYYGMETSLTHYKLWDYMTPISIITTNRVRKGSIELLGRNATIRKVQKSKFFGYSMVQYKDMYIPMADIEKTLIDSVYFHTPFSTQVYAAITKKIDKRRLNSYLKKYSLIVKKEVYNVIDESFDVLGNKRLKSFKREKDDKKRMPLG